MTRKAHKRMLKNLAAHEKKKADWAAFLKIATKRDIVLIIAVAEAITIIILSVLLAGRG